jgi:prepilin-type N-terminal cleavage/methylation domain-containing protein
MVRELHGKPYAPVFAELQLAGGCAVLSSRIRRFQARKVTGDSRGKRKSQKRGFTLLEVSIAILVLLVGLVAVAQLVGSSLTSNSTNRKDSVTLVLAQRELDQMVEQPVKATQFTDALGNACSLGNPATPNTVVGSTVAMVNNRAVIDFSAGQVAGYGFTYQDPEDPYGTRYEVRWAVISTGNGGTVNSKRLIIGARQAGGNGYFQPVALDTMVEK